MENTCMKKENSLLLKLKKITKEKEMWIDCVESGRSLSSLKKEGINLAELG